MNKPGRPIDLRLLGGPRGYQMLPITEAGARWAYLHFEETRWQGASVALAASELQRVLLCCAVEDLVVLPARNN